MTVFATASRSLWVRALFDLRRRGLRHPLFALVLAAPLAFAACGDDDDSTDANDTSPADTAGTGGTTGSTDSGDTTDTTGGSTTGDDSGATGTETDTATDTDSGTGTDTATETDTGGEAALASGDFSLVLIAGPGLELRKADGTILTTLPIDGLQIGQVRKVSADYNYDPYWLDPDPANPLPGDVPLGLAWRSLKTLTVASQSATSLTFDATFENGIEATLTVTLPAGETGHFALELKPKVTDLSQNLAYYRFRPVVDETEDYYGLGGYLDTTHHRGKKREMQIEVFPKLESYYNEAHTPIPLLIGTRGWGLFIESSYPGTFDVAATDPKRVDAIFGTGISTSSGIKFHLYAEERPLNITKHYYATTGAARIPGRWGFGPLLWRDENDNQAQVESDIQTMRDLDLAHSGMWIDRPYQTEIGNFDWNPAKFPDAQAMIDYAHAMGFRMGVWHVPYVSRKATANRAEADSKGYFPSEVGLRLNQFDSDVLDLTNPEALAWWKGLLKSYTEMGIEGFKLDYGEDVVTGSSGKRANKFLFANGETEQTMHKGYIEAWHRPYAESVPEGTSFIIARSARWGGQKYLDVIWPGDLQANFEKFKDVRDDGKLSVGGLYPSMIYGLSLGPSGLPFYGSDTGGYRSSPPNDECFARWFEQTALSSVMQIGGSDNQVAWELDKYKFTQETLDSYRLFTRLHLRLFAYEYSLAQRVAETGEPIQRPYGLQLPQYDVHLDDQYFFGPSLFVAPVVEEGATTKDVYFAPGTWVDWWDGTIKTVKAAAPEKVTIAAPLHFLPLYLADNAVIPMLRPTIDTISPTDFPDKVDSYANDAGLLWVRVVPAIGTGAGSGSFDVFDGAKVGFNRTQIGGITLTYTAGTEFKQGVVFEVMGLATMPSNVRDSGGPLTKFNSLAELEAAPLGYFAETLTGSTRVFVKSASANASVIVEP